MYQFQDVITISVLLNHSEVRARMLTPMRTLQLSPQEYASIVYGTQVERLQLDESMNPPGATFCTGILDQYPAFNEQYKQLMNRLKQLGKDYLEDSVAKKLNDALDKIYEGKSEFAAGFNMEETNALKTVLEEFVVIHHQQDARGTQEEMMIRLVDEISDRCAVGLVGRISDLCRAFNPDQTLTGLLAVHRGNVVNMMDAAGDVHNILKIANYLNVMGYNIPMTTTMDDKWYRGEFGDNDKEYIITNFEKNYFSFNTIIQLTTMIEQKVMAIIFDKNNTVVEACNKMSAYFKNILGYDIDLNQIVTYDENATGNKSSDIMALKREDDNTTLPSIAGGGILNKLFSDIDDPTRVMRLKIGSISITKFNGMKSSLIMNDDKLSSDLELCEWIKINKDSPLMEDLMKFLIDRPLILLSIYQSGFDALKYIRENFGISVLANTAKDDHDACERLFDALKDTDAINDELKFEVEENNQKCRVVDILVKYGSCDVLEAYILAEKTVKIGYDLDSNNMMWLEDKLVKEIYQRSSDFDRVKMDAFLASTYKPTLNELFMISRIIFEHIFRHDINMQVDIIDQMNLLFETDITKVIEMYKEYRNGTDGPQYHLRALSVLKYMNNHGDPELSLKQKCNHLGAIVALPVEASIAESIQNSDSSLLKMWLVNLFDWDLRVKIEAKPVGVRASEYYFDYGQSFVTPLQIRKSYFDHLTIASQTSLIDSTSSFKQFLGELIADDGNLSWLDAYMVNHERHDVIDFYFSYLVSMKSNDFILSSLMYLYSNKDAPLKLRENFYKKHARWVRENTDLIFKGIRTNQLSAVLGCELVSTGFAVSSELNEKLKLLFNAIDESDNFDQLMAPLFTNVSFNQLFFHKLFVYSEVSLLKKFNADQVYKLCCEHELYMESYFARPECSVSLLQDMKIHGVPLKYNLPVSAPEYFRSYMISKGIISFDTSEGQSALVNAFKSGVTKKDIMLMLDKMMHFDYVDSDGNNYLHHMLLHVDKCKLLDERDYSAIYKLLSSRPKLLNEVNHRGNTPLMEFIQSVPPASHHLAFIHDIANNHDHKLELNIINHEGKTLRELFDSVYQGENADIFKPAANNSPERKRRKFG